MAAPLYLFTIVASCMAVAPPACAIDASRPGEFSGDGVIQQYAGLRPYPAPQAEVGKALSVEYASGYVSGVADATEGKVWCNKHGVRPHELKERVCIYIEALPRKRRSEPAKVLIAEALAREFPCE